MEIIPILKYGVIISCLVSVVSLSILVLKTFSFGKRQLYAEPKGDVKKGILYAFGKGMMPWEKESAVKHLPSYIGGILYHLGVFGAMFYLLVWLDIVNMMAFAISFVIFFTIFLNIEVFMIYKKLLFK